MKLETKRSETPRLKKLSGEWRPFTEPLEDREIRQRLDALEEKVKQLQQNQKEVKK